MSHGFFFFVIILCGAITFSERGSFLLFQSGKDPHPRLAKALRLVPAAVLPALVTPALFMANGYLDISLSNPRLLAGVVALAIALWKRSVFLTLVSGLTALWVIQWLTV
ncbi:hypothetical protein DSLASN_21980 [Desulfoluna limicola]|uniref:Branched-chain amino acid ABC transporter n=1 Tax=Desulfoluna limicola TaxID=2810562 RepID=A0ABM7PHK8_9BACT|nr:AzlD domain-containing protein [Desulfoluna limicola]BCS96566.1 hypothetical protein DSLASN_21980 [Desulfoluna limicola]